LFDECTSNLLVREDGNICGGTCVRGKYLIVPEGVCISNCDSSIYVTKDNTWGLCKDVNNTHQYKIINGIECLSEKPHNTEYYNENLKLLICKSGYILNDSFCVPHYYEACETYVDYSTLKIIKNV